MAALSMGAFGAYKQAYSRYLQEQEECERRIQNGQDGNDGNDTQTVWVTKRYIPTDLRLTAPVPRHKLLAPKELPCPDQNWIPNRDPSLKSFLRRESSIHVSQPATRCEDYSTLRQILPSRGSSFRLCPPNWGTSYSFPPIMQEKKTSRFPLVNSQMTRYVDDMHLTNRLFKLH